MIRDTFFYRKHCLAQRLGSHHRTALLLELALQVAHHMLNGLIVQRAALILEDETQGIGLLALGEFVTLVDIKQ